MSNRAKEINADVERFWTFLETMLVDSSDTEKMAVKSNLQSLVKGVILTTQNSISDNLFELRNEIKL